MIPATPEVIGEILQQRIFPRIFAQLPSENQRSAGICVIYHRASDGSYSLLHRIQVGSVARAKLKNIAEAAEEQALRLTKFPGHFSSCESRNPEEHKWSGAIRGVNHIYSYYGSTEEANEAAMLLLASWFKDLPAGMDRRIAHTSSNAIYSKLLEERPSAS